MSTMKAFAARKAKRKVDIGASGLIVRDLDPARPFRKDETIQTAN
jgi:hypothetical protein